MVLTKKIYLRFIIYFTVFSFVVAFLTAFVTYNAEGYKLSENVYKLAETMADQKRNAIRFALKGIEDQVSAIIDNPLFGQYLSHPSQISQAQAENLFLYVSNANNQFFQVRFIDAKGFEKIRVERPRGTFQSILIPEENLQDKSLRYYYKELLTASPGQFWHSSLDLNIENQRVEKPIRPTLRVASPVFNNGVFAGLVIINTEMSHLLDVLQESSEFNVYLVDEDGYILINPNDALNWARYLDTGYKIPSVLSEITMDVLKTPRYRSEDWFSFSLKEDFKSREQLFLILETKKDFLNSLNEQNLQVTLYLALLILLVAIPTALLIAVSPSRLQQKLNVEIEKNTKALAIIDEYVVTASLDLEANFTKVSKAMCELSGYDESELIGKPSTILKAPDSVDEQSEEIWYKLSQGLIWRGQVKDQAKDGSIFWLDSTFLPEYEGEKIIGYREVSQNITNEKMIEAISETDVLTGLCNRVRLDVVLENELQRVKRSQSSFSVIMVDVDYFKAVNDQYGHLVGDSVLTELANLLKDNSRQVDTVGRWGGEEFMILCVDTKLNGAVELAEKLRQIICQHTFEHIGHKTASFGVSEATAEDGVDQVITRADNALYQAKALGRNRVEFG